MMAERKVDVKLQKVFGAAETGRKPPPMNLSPNPSIQDLHASTSLSVLFRLEKKINP